MHGHKWHEHKKHEHKCQKCQSSMSRATSHPVHIKSAIDLLKARLGSFRETSTQSRPAKGIALSWKRGCAARAACRHAGAWPLRPPGAVAITDRREGFVLSISVGATEIPQDNDDIPIHNRESYLESRFSGAAHQTQRASLF
eukprot:1160294-Pelagomonas_calceolata.AAC.7